MDALPNMIRSLMSPRGPETTATAFLNSVLETVLRESGGHGGTIHRVDPADGLLKIAAWTANIPPPVLDAVRVVPVGKGMAGVAAERRAPVTTCDLQTDNAGGVARPGAKKTGFRGSICIPMVSSNGRLAGTLGVGCAETREFSEREVNALLATGTVIADALLEHS